MRAKNKLQKYVDVLAETDEHRPILGNTFREYYPNNYACYPKKVKFEVQCQTSRVESENEDSQSDSSQQRYQTDISRQLYQVPEYRRHNMVNHELPEDPGLSSDVLDVQKNINDYRNKLLNQIRCGEDGNIDVKELQESVKWRQMMVQECDGNQVQLSEASTAVTESSQKENKKRATGPKFYLRTQQSHGIEDRPNFLTVCKNKYGADYPEEQGYRYRTNNQLFVDYMLGKERKPKSSQYNSLANSPRSELSIDKNELLSQDTRFDANLKNRRTKQFIKDKFEQDFDDDIVAKMDETIENFVRPATLDVAYVQGKDELQAPPTDLNIKSESFPLKEDHRKALITNVSKQIRKRGFTTIPVNRHKKSFLEFPLLFKDSIEAMLAQLAVKRHEKMRSSIHYNPTPDDRLMNALLSYQKFLKTGKIDQNSVDLINNIFLKGDQPFLTQREPKTEEFILDLYKQFPKDYITGPEHTCEEKWIHEKKATIHRMKERRYRRWRKERQFYKDNYTVQEGKLVNTGQRWINIEKVEDRMYTVYKKRVAWEVDRMKKETERSIKGRDKEFEKKYLKQMKGENSFIEEEESVQETSSEQQNDQVGLFKQKPNKPNQVNIQLREEQIKDELERPLFEEINDMAEQLNQLEFQKEQLIAKPFKGDSDINTTIVGSTWDDRDSQQTAISTNYETAAKYPRRDSNDNSFDNQSQIPSLVAGVTVKSDYPYSTTPYKSRNAGVDNQTSTQQKTISGISVKSNSKVKFDIKEQNDSFDRLVKHVETRSHYQKDFSDLESRFQNVLSNIDENKNEFNKTVSEAKSNFDKQMIKRNKNKKY